ncbi:hypothetical protein Glove_329g30 [Diversispora epigaea]|uniref:Uncharacterized protein n=1 Tax=Diversispora epigaea TaxID=1348612 RepID=A0A397HSI0_9GLOM|nr:hypothetical protein Glove_329g30 [Diversispora epigaea]
MSDITSETLHSSKKICPLDSKELKDNELERLTMFSTVDSLDSVPLHTETLNQQKMNPDIL